MKIIKDKKMLYICIGVLVVILAAIIVALAVSSASAGKDNEASSAVTQAPAVTQQVVSTAPPETPPITPPAADPADPASGSDIVLNTGELPVTPRPSTDTDYVAPSPAASEPVGNTEPSSSD